MIEMHVRGVDFYFFNTPIITAQAWIRGFLSPMHYPARNPPNR